MWYEFRNPDGTKEAWWRALITAPIWQEVVFRFLPFYLFYKSPSNFLLVGLISSLAFAAIHFIAGKWFVLYTFFGGLVLWATMVHFGLLEAILLHSAVNVIDKTFGLRLRIMGRELRE
jgi:membrane protease YdiL (CAAX protease family)